ncbi:protein bicaudal D [Lepeophtheirus salmonis]|uniref:Protein bicaudal D n=1 Tax=Lepeophtheirus salmonis TaxID=72036 RepID=A0A0K2V1C7_LEPSM|nr:protein bicaudal D-like [Lepeophtheirus salmonis]XP_040583387.1 protein bicaudal D-like [Lepeophtheirus salmonis]XP_040583388.1 protein bicaudal D-like [Lepeophtheirus salmonis]
MSEDVPSLKSELDRLQRDLDQTSAEKIQSAQYGLALLKEKEQLEERCNEIEAAYEVNKHELQVTQEALAKFQSSQQVSTRTGIEHEESLLTESAARESSLNTQIIDMELDIKYTKSEVTRLQTEKERIEQEYAEVIKLKEIVEKEFKEVKAELKDYKYRENRHLIDYSELEEENIALQKQIIGLRSSQVEFEGAKHEIRHLQEEVDILNEQNHEMTNLKKIAEKQLEEALESLQAEREQRYMLKKELDSKLNSENMNMLGNLALSIQGMTTSTTGSSTIIEGGIHVEDEEDGPIFKKLEDVTAAAAASAPDSGPTSDLFSEIHLNELKSLEKKFENSETEKTALLNNLKESRDVLDKTRGQMTAQQVEIAKLSSHLSALMKIREDLSGNWSEQAERELVQMEDNLKNLVSSNECIKEPDVAINKLKSELITLRNDLVSLETKNNHLHFDIRILEKLSSESARAIGTSEFEMQNIQNELSKLYTEVCASIGHIPSRIIVDYKKQSDDIANDLSHSFRTQALKLKTSKHLSNNSDGMGDPVAIQNSLETIKDMIKYLKDAIEKSIAGGANSGGDPKASSKSSSASEVRISERGEPISLDEMSDSREQVVKLKSLLSTKREQIATLRTVVKANKQTAEVALTNLKSKYNKEKTVVSETMMKLRNELRLLKEDAATFSSLRAMFAARCEEYATQIDELNRQYASAEDEKKTLNQLLRMAIHQKLELTQKLEEVEMASEMRHNTPRRTRGVANTSKSGRGTSRSSSNYDHKSSRLDNH